MANIEAEPSRLPPRQDARHARIDYLATLTFAATAVAAPARAAAIQPFDQAVFKAAQDLRRRG